MRLQSIFANLALSNKDFHRPGGFWKAFKDYDGAQLSLREHQDAYEFFTRLQVTPGTRQERMEALIKDDQLRAALLFNPRLISCDFFGPLGEAAIIVCHVQSAAFPNSCNCGLWTYRMESFASSYPVVGCFGALTCTLLNPIYSGLWC